MIPPHIKNKFSEHPQAIMRPIHLKLSESIIEHLEHTSQEHGFHCIQSLIRLYIRQGLDRDNINYSLAHDEVFLEQLRQKGISQKLIEQAIIETNEINHSSEHVL